MSIRATASASPPLLPGPATTIMRWLGRNLATISAVTIEAARSIRSIELIFWLSHVAVSTAWIACESIIFMSVRFWGNRGCASPPILFQLAKILRSAD